MAATSPHPIAHRRVASAVQFVFVLDALALGLVGSVLLLAGASPFESAGLAMALATGIVILGVHHVWYVRHRAEIEHDPQRVRARERRGF